MTAGAIIGAILLTAATIGLATVVVHALERVLGLSAQSSPRRPTGFLVRARAHFPAIRAGVWFLACVLGLAILLAMTSPTATLVIGSPLLVATGLALRDGFGSALGGMLLVVERPFQTGDRVLLGDLEGTVAAVGILQTRITTDDGHHVRVPNRRFVAEAYETLQRGRRDLPVEMTLTKPDHLSLAEAKDFAHRAAVVSRYASPRRCPDVFVESKPTLGLVVKVRAFVCQPSLAERYRSDVLEIWLEQTKPGSRNGD